MALVDKRLMAELAKLQKCPLPYASARPRPANIRKWDGVLLGPVGTPYEGGKFNFTMEFYSDYPMRPPRVEFKTRIYHCNINPIGNVCLDVLKLPADKGAWRSAMGIESILVSLHQLLGDPNPNDPLVSSIAVHYKKDREDHDRTAKIWTQRYSMTK